MTPAKENLGGHTSIAGGVWKAIERGAKLDMGAVQIFVKSQQQWKAKPLKDEDAERFRKTFDESEVNYVIAHNSYLHNFAAPEDELWEKSIHALGQEMERAAKLGVPSIVIHPGSPKDESEAFGIKRIAAAMDRLYDEYGAHPVTILLEITAGQGSHLGYRFEHLRDIMDQATCRERLAVCLDTCHLFAAGYDLRTRESYDDVIQEFDRIIGAKLLRAWHLNDSKHPIDSRKDRHANIGDGEIGEDAFGFIVNDERWNEIPMILETPDADTMHEVDLKRLRSLRG